MRNIAELLNHYKTGKIDMETIELTHLEFYKNSNSDLIFWVDNVDIIGEFLFTFNKKKIYNLFADYPHKLTETEKYIFDNENPYWRDFFRDRNE